MSIARMAALAAKAGALDDENDQVSSKSPGEICAALSAIADRYNAGCPFKPGDFITPREGANVRGKGEPHVVLEVTERPDPDFRSASASKDTSSSSYGARRDIRVACAVGEQLPAFWVESWQFEPYRGPGSEAAAA